MNEPKNIILSHKQVSYRAFPKKINFALQEGSCNQKCPKCFVHGTNNDGEKKISGAMPEDQIVRLLQEASRHAAFVSPSFFSEPMVARNFKFFVREAKKNNLPVNICTNGMLLNDEMITFLLDMNVELLSISFDAYSKDVFKKVRGVDKLDKVVNNVLKLLKMRASKTTPRVTVSFGIEDANKHEKQNFVDFWTPHADCVKIYGVYGYEKRLYDIEVPSVRLPCREVFDQMSIYIDGTALICCLDGFAKTNLGNVFAQDIATVWNSNTYNAVRMSHIKNDYSDLEFCKDCKLWANFDIIQERIVGDIQIRSSEGIEYYNRLDRLEGWTNEIRRIEINEIFKP